MPFTDVIDNYSNGASGTITDVNGDQVGYTVSGTSPTTDWNGLDGGARVNADGSQAFTVTFDQPVIGAAIQMSGSDANEIYYIEIDGVTVNLQSLIDNGEATFTQSGAATHEIGADGSINGGHYSDGSIAELVFNIPVNSLGVYGTNGNSGNWDYFEVGIDATAFDIVCFSHGTMLSTPSGPRRIQDLTAGDLVLTARNGAQPIAWIGASTFTAAQHAACCHLRPVVISAGALGQGLPQRDLRISRQHRMVISSKIAARMFGTTDVMVPAIKLTQLPGIYLDDTCDGVTYFHILLENHDVIFAEGAPTESLFLGEQALRTLSPRNRAEIQQALTALGHHESHSQPCLSILPGKRQKRLIERHHKNRQPLLVSSSLT
ncbi:Hint domain-containing protein [Algirhabdus cladophorae]|uniref:Hint domain-containing protein n=1 Tax=Algirhabdus cladophorae TaxID=3377108 RepID=UPI003B8487F5